MEGFLGYKGLKDQRHIVQGVVLSNMLVHLSCRVFIETLCYLSNNVVKVRPKSGGILK